MSFSRRTLYLGDSWDLEVTSSGGVKELDGAIATAQNVSNECRLFTNDAFFDTARGIPYFQEILGKKKVVREQVIRRHYNDAAMLVDDVRNVISVIIQKDGGRTLSGKINFITHGDDVGIETNAIF